MVKPSGVARYDAWIILIRARMHILKTAPIEAMRILWAAEDAVVEQMEPVWYWEGKDGT